MLNQTIQRELTWFYPWLVQFSRRLLGGERVGHTLQPTALAHEVLGKMLSWDGQLTDSTERSLQQLAASIARKTLVDSGRRHIIRRKALKRIGTKQAETVVEVTPKAVESLLGAVEELKTFDPSLARLVELRFFEGYSQKEAMEILSLAPRTAARKWVFAKAYLARAMAEA
jgi:DNA-directed RNA polymerase specialized sigma24 family protein